MANGTGTTMLRPAALPGGGRAVDRNHCPHCGGAVREASPQAPLSRAPSATAGAELTRRETAVLDLLTEGLTDRQIARRLAISPRTVDTHLGHAYAKLGVRGRVAAATRWLTSRQAAVSA